MTAPVPTPRITPAPERPYPIHLGVCGWCGQPLTDLRRRWCPPMPPTEYSACQWAYLASIGPGFREMVRIANAERNGGKNRCDGCGESDGIEWEADHIIPLALGGVNDPVHNGALLCRPCHREKTARDAADIAAVRRPDGPTGRARRREEGHRKVKPLDDFGGRS